MPDLIRIDSAETAKKLEDAERVPIFELDGKVYDVPKVARADVGLEYLDRVEDDGPDVAQAWLIRTMVGDEGFDALRNVKGLEQKDWTAIFDRVRDIVNPKARGLRG